MAVNIVVMLKQTPDTESIIRIASNGRSIVTDDIKWIINPYDEFALEAALRLREQHGGKVSLVSYGPSRVVEAIRTALAMGADDAFLLDDALLADGDLLGALRAMATVVRSLNPDIICCGAKAVDYDQAQRGAMMAEFLGWPHLALAVALQSDATKVTIERPIEGGIVTLEATLPVLVTFGGSHSIWNPRYASLPGIMKAKKKPLTIKSLNDIGLNPTEFGGSSAKILITALEPPPKRPPGRIIDGNLDIEGKARELVRALHEEAKVI
jgi:electron transfer flavoprotein beta subunit